MTPSASPDHNEAASELWSLIKAHLPARLRVGTDLDWVLAVPGDKRFIVNAPRPDVVVWPREHAKVSEPILAVEVLSDSDTYRIDAKRFAYAIAGLPVYLEVDLEAGVLHRYELITGELTIMQTGPEITLTLPGVEPFTIHIDQLRS